MTTRGDKPLKLPYIRPTRNPMAWLGFPRLPAAAPPLEPCPSRIRGDAMTAEIDPRCIRPKVYFALRRMGFPWWTCVRIMWYGADLRAVET